MDSYKIAEYLEKTYPDQPSLYYPGQTCPVDPNSAEAKMAKAYLALFAAGTFAFRNPDLLRTNPSPLAPITSKLSPPHTRADCSP